MLLQGYMKGPDLPNLRDRLYLKHSKSEYSGSFLDCHLIHSRSKILIIFFHRFKALYTYCIIPFDFTLLSSTRPRPSLSSRSKAASTAARRLLFIRPLSQSTKASRSRIPDLSTCLVRRRDSEGSRYDDGIGYDDVVTTPMPQQSTTRTRSLEVNSLPTLVNVVEVLCRSVRGHQQIYARCYEGDPVLEDFPSTSPGLDLGLQWCSYL